MVSFEPLYTCCCFGHRTICETEELKAQLLTTMEHLVVCERVDTFLFGSKSQFNELCWELVTKLRESYPHVKRVYVRAEYPVINDDYRQYLLQRYEDTYYPESMVGAGRSVYVKRNREMIDNSRFCIVYYDATTTRKSGTKIALDYAVKQGNKPYIFGNTKYGL